jgi:hypothetical protein
VALSDKIARTPQTRPNYATLCKHALVTANGDDMSLPVSYAASAKIREIICAIFFRYKFFSDFRDFSEVVSWLML